MYPESPAQHLPVPPRDVLERFHVHEPTDTRFRSSARLLQSIWRERRKLDIGSYSRQYGSPLPLGSRLGEAAANAGFNFLTPGIARQVRREIAYRERGALIEEQRAWGNLLSSTALTFNLLVPLKLNFALATAILTNVFRVDVAQVDGVYFETSPGRGDPAFIGDHTALDALIAYTSSEGSREFIGIEMKYAESAPGNVYPVRERLDLLAYRSGLFVHHSAPELRQPAHRQFFAEHVLCHSMVHEQRLFDGGRFVVIAPNCNDEVARMVDGYRQQLSPDHRQVLSFDSLSLEAFVQAICGAGELELAKALDDRYTNFDPVYDLIDDWQPHSL